MSEDAKMSTFNEICLEFNINVANPGQADLDKLINSPYARLN